MTCLRMLFLASKGIVLPIERDGDTTMDSFHVRVFRVNPAGSVGYRNKITTQMFVQNMALVDNDRVGVAVDMGASTARVYISPEDKFDYNYGVVDVIHKYVKSLVLSGDQKLCYPLTQSEKENNDFGISCVPKTGSPVVVM